MLRETYGGDIDLLDAFTGGLAEGDEMLSRDVLGELLRVCAWLHLARTCGIMRRMQKFGSVIRGKFLKPNDIL